MWLVSAQNYEENVSNTQNTSEHSHRFHRAHQTPALRQGQSQGQAAASNSLAPHSGVATGMSPSKFKLVNKSDDSIWIFPPSSSSSSIILPSFIFFLICCWRLPASGKVLPIERHTQKLHLPLLYLSLPAKFQEQCYKTQIYMWCLIKFSESSTA